MTLLQHFYFCITFLENWAIIIKFHCENGVSTQIHYFYFCPTFHQFWAQFDFNFKIGVIGHELLILLIYLNFNQYCQELINLVTLFESRADECSCRKYLSQELIKLKAMGQGNQIIGHYFTIWCILDLNWIWYELAKILWKELFRWLNSIGLQFSGIRSDLVNIWFKLCYSHFER